MTIEKYYLFINDGYECDYFIGETLEEVRNKIKEIQEKEEDYNSWFIVKGIEVLNSDD